MNVAISAIRTKNIKLNRSELIESIQSLGHNVYYIGQDSDDELHQDYKKYNVRFLSIPLGRSNTNPFREIKSIIQTKKVLRENNIETLISYGIRTLPTMVIAAKLAGVKKVLCIVNGSGRLFQIIGLKGLLVRSISYPMLCLSFLMTNYVLFQNMDDLKMIKGKGLLWRKNYGKVNGSGVNMDKYKSDWLQVNPIFTMIGRLTGDKGVNEYVQAAKIVKSMYPKTEFYLIGPMDNDDSSVDVNALKKAIDDNIIFLEGEVEDVRPYINKCRIFVLPSYHEGTPRTVLEAMAMGRPVITTDAPGCRETVNDGLNGFLIPIKSSDILAEKMIWMIEHREETEKMGEQSLIICKNKFDVNEVNKIILKSINL